MLIEQVYFYLYTSRSLINEKNKRLASVNSRIKTCRIVLGTVKMKNIRKFLFARMCVDQSISEDLNSQFLL